MVNDQQVICPNCSATIPSNMRFCTNCGTEIEENKDQRETSGTGNNPNNGTQHQNPQEDPINDAIGSLKKSGEEFIQDIGGIFNNGPKNQPKTQYCPECSAVIPNNVRFCTKCGTPIEQKTHITPDQNVVVKTKHNDELDQLQYLEKLANLRDKGIISDEEFEKKKKDILKL